MPTDPVRRLAVSTPKPAPLALPPRRAVATIVATVLGLVLLFSFKTPDDPSISSSRVAIAQGTPAPRATLPSVASGTARPGAGAEALSPPASSSPAPSPPPPGDASQEVDGDVIPTRFGDIQVRLVESGGTIVDIQSLQLPFDRRRSLEISQFVEPILLSEALQAQSSQIDSISGATYTSEAYRMSLQSALDRVHG